MQHEIDIDLAGGDVDAPDRIDARCRPRTVRPGLPPVLGHGRPDRRDTRLRRQEQADVMALFRKAGKIVPAQGQAAHARRDVGHADNRHLAEIGKRGAGRGAALPDDVRRLAAGEFVDMLRDAPLEQGERGIVLSGEAERDASVMHGGRGGTDLEAHRPFARRAGHRAVLLEMVAQMKHHRMRRGQGDEGLGSVPHHARAFLSAACMAAGSAGDPLPSGRPVARTIAGTARTAIAVKAPKSAVKPRCSAA